MYAKDSYITWKQWVQDTRYLNKNGLLFKEAYPTERALSLKTIKPFLSITRSSESKFRSIDREDVTNFGCTPVAFGQVLYALSDLPGFKDLKYTNGESVLWDRMYPGDSYYNVESQRFLGWMTENLDPYYSSKGTIIYNVDAKDFVEEKLGDYVSLRYDNCVVPMDWDGYGWSEDKVVAEEFFKYPKCFVIMTASSWYLGFLSYHTFVIDGMFEFKKWIEDDGWFSSSMVYATRHLYHINAGWDDKKCNGYYLYVQDVDDKFGYTGVNGKVDYRSKPSYTVIRPK